MISLSRYIIATFKRATDNINYDYDQDDNDDDDDDNDMGINRNGLGAKCFREGQSLKLSARD